MSTFTWFNGNQGVYAYRDFRIFDPIFSTKTSITSRYNGERGDYDPAQMPWEMEIIFEGAEIHTFDSGARAGETVYVAGSITRINWYDDAGNLLLQANDLEIDLASFTRLQSAGVGDIWDYITRGGGVFTGSDNASSRDNDRTGDDIDTGARDDTVNGRRGNDYIKDAGGADTYIGGAGWDELSYDEWFWNPTGALSGIVAKEDRECHGAGRPR